MHVAFPEASRVRFISDDRLSNDEYFAFCKSNPELRIERNAEGEIIIVPPAGMESDNRSVGVATQLCNWAAANGGKCFGSSVQFLLPDGSGLSPDAAWISDQALEKIPKTQRKKFPLLSPEFVIEVMSPSDRLKEAKAKMETWIANGVQLAWLIDGDAETVYIYRKGHPPKTRRGIRELAGVGPVEGFTLQLQPIWKGLK